MFQYFLNPWLLAGLVGIGLPLAAHLISRRRFDVVDWGAMQFLNPSRKTRRRMQLEELLLLLLRMGVIGLLAAGRVASVDSRRLASWLSFRRLPHCGAGD